MATATLKLKGLGLSRTEACYLLRALEHPRHNYERHGYDRGISVENLFKRGYFESVLDLSEEERKRNEEAMQHFAEDAHKLLPDNWKGAMMLLRNNEKLTAQNQAIVARLTEEGEQKAKEVQELGYTSRELEFGTRY